jgi:hypothetical protein
MRLNARPPFAARSAILTRAQLFKVDFGRLPNVSLQQLAHLTQSVAALIRRVGGHAIARNVQGIVAHVCVVGGEQYTDVRRDAGQDQYIGTQVFKQNIECGRVKPGVFGLQHKVVVLIGAQSL